MSKELPGIPSPPPFELSDEERSIIRDSLALLIQQNNRAITKYASQAPLADHFRAANVRINQLLQRINA